MKIKKLIAGGLSALILAMGVGMGSASAASVSSNGISANNEYSNLSESSSKQDVLAVKNDNSWPVTVYVTTQTAGPNELWQNVASKTINLQPEEKVYLLEGSGMNWGERATFRFQIHSIGHGYTDGRNLGTFYTNSTYVGW